MQNLLNVADAVLNLADAVWDLGRSMCSITPQTESEYMYERSQR